MKTVFSSVIIFIAMLQNISSHPVAYLPMPTQGGWQLIGATEARFSIDHDVILVNGPFNNFRRIKFKVTGAPLHMVKLVVTYGNGAPDNIETLFLIPKGAESRVIDLRGIGERKVRRIDFWYDTSGITRGSAHVVMFGMK